MEQQVICPRGASRYTWRQGDSLEGLALRNGTTVQAIVLANEDRDLNDLRDGDTVCVPPRQLTCIAGDIYTVREGDTGTSIARTYGISTVELQERNPFADINILTPGQALCVPGRSAGGSGGGSSGSGGGSGTPGGGTGGSGGGSGTPGGGTGGSGGSSGGTVAAPCPTGYRRGTVNFGQTFEDLLIQYNVSYNAMRQANPALSPARLTPGQRFCAPPSGTRILCAGGGYSYVLEEDDNLAAVAERFGLTRARLLRLNPSLAPSDFIPGRTVCVG